MYRMKERKDFISLADLVRDFQRQGWDMTGGKHAKCVVHSIGVIRNWTSRYGT